MGLAHPARTSLLVAGLASAAAGVLACGASIQALYEGDVRFEHCMALDARPDVKPSIRHACWVEWVEFYTVGQTRDRIDYAILREEQLSRDEAAPAPAPTRAPPPLLVAADGGALDAAVASVEEPSGCAEECEKSLEACRAKCETPSCEDGCGARQRRCVKRCR